MKRGDFSVLALVCSVFVILGCSSSISLMELSSSGFPSYTDAEVLLEFKKGITLDPKCMLSNWTLQNVEGVCSNWAGVTCSNKSNVIKLDLHHLFLQGVLSPSLSNLKFLHTLNLRQNEFYGTIPVEYGQLRYIRMLDLSSNFFYGNVPKEFGMLKSIRKLHLESNHLEGPIPDSLCNCTQLLSFYLSSNSLSGLIPDCWGRLSKLRKLDFRSNQINGQFPESFRNLSLVMLNLDLNEMSGILPSWVTNLTSLVEFRFADIYGRLPVQLGNLIHLQTLHLGGEFMGPIPMDLFRLSNLRDLYLSSNNLEGEIPRALVNLSQLANLMMGNNLTGSIPSELGQVKELTHLSLASDSLSSQIPPQLGNLQKLWWIELNGANLWGSIPQEFCNLTLLQRLYLGGQFNVEVPTCIGNISSLYEIKWNIERFSEMPVASLNLTNLHFITISSGSYPEGFLQSMCALAKLAWLDTRGNIGGIIPYCIGHMKQLVHLALVSSKLSGSIPQSFGNLTNLQKLDISNNTLIGNIPNTMSNCKELKILQLSGNLFTGEITTVFPGSLNVLSAFSNNFSGSLFKSLQSCVNIIILDFRRNSLNGALPSNLKYMKKLRVLDLSYNVLEGTIPEWIVNYTFLQVLDLSNNKFNGRIPMHLESLKRFQKSWNFIDEVVKIKGEDFYMPFDYIQYVQLILTVKGLELSHNRIISRNNLLDLSCNHLSGEIPESIGNMTDIRLLNLSHNMLKGYIPARIGNLSNLEELDLRCNQLSGPLPSELALLTFLSSFNVSHNKLCGRTPNTPQFSTFDESSFQDNQCLCGYSKNFPCEKAKDTDVDLNGRKNSGNGFWDWVDENISLVALGLGFGLGFGGLIALYFLWDAVQRFYGRYLI